VRCSLGSDVRLAARTFRCTHGGVVIERDPNAAKHVTHLAGSSLERRNACGAARAGRGLATPGQLAVRKQEPDAFDASLANGKFWRTAFFPHPQGVTSRMLWCGLGRALGRMRVQREPVLSSPQPPFPAGGQHPLAAVVGRGHMIGPDVDLLRTPQ
jgi:hypothetical protein